MAKSLFKAKALMAPMSGITDLPFRRIIRANGCQFAFTEMIAVKPLVTRHYKTIGFLDTHASDTPCGAQVVGRDPDLLAQAVRILEDIGQFSVIDVNFGCPVKKVVGKGEGSALLKEPKQIERIITKLVGAVKVPISCKIRLGWSKQTINAPEIARIAEGSGASAITVHGRTKDAGYGGPVDLNLIAQVKKAVAIPVIGNGNVFTRHDAGAMFERTGCDHVMIGRGALGNPWLFGEIEADKDDPRKGRILTVKKTLLEHAKLLHKQYGEKKSVTLLRKVGCWYFKGFSQKASYKKAMNAITSYDEFLDIVDEYVEGQAS